MMKIAKLSLFVVFFTLLLPDVVFAQQRAFSREFFGKVAAGGKGISGVAVSDGLQVSYTDSKGAYRLLSTEADFIFISLPSGYRAPLVDGIPKYFERVDNTWPERKRIDFELEHQPGSQEKYKLIVCADPQVGYDEDVPKLDVVLADMKNYVKESFADTAVYGIVCGDIIESMKQVSPTLQTIRQRFKETEIPFFYVAGNHDMDLGARSDALSKERYKQVFGPTYYSFNLGKVHYVVLDDVFGTGRPYGYIGYLEERQLRWLEQDLTKIPAGGTVVVSVHIPSYSAAARKGDYGNEDIKKVIQNRQVLYKMLSPYKAHIFSGHEHYQENYTINESLFEHVHGALCGIFWQTPYNSDGTPLGYTVYEVDGDKISWYFKAAGENSNTQCVSYLPGADKHNPTALVLNVWNYDPAWKVYLYEDGVKTGEMKPSKGWDPNVVQYVKDYQQYFRYKNVGAGPTEHMFYTVPQNKTAAFKIQLIDRFGKSYWSVPGNVQLQQVRFR